MTVRLEAHFNADFPLEWILDDEGEILQAPGKATSEAICEIFKRLGCKIGEPEYEHGWQFGIETEAGWFSGQVIYFGDEFDGDEWRVHFGCADFLGHSKKSLRAAMKALPRLNAELGRDARFRNVRWYAENEFHETAPGSAEPVSPADFRRGAPSLLAAVTLRPLAMFDADFPLQRLGDANDDKVRRSAKEMSNAIADMLRSLGCKVDAPEHAPEGGWRFDFQRRLSRLRCRVARQESWLLVCEARKGLFGVSYGDWHGLLRILPRLDAELRKDVRFSNIRWLSREEHRAGRPGGSEPVVFD